MEWIKTSEGMPTPGVCVLVCIDGNQYIDEDAYPHTVIGFHLTKFFWNAEYDDLDSYDWLDVDEHGAHFYPAGWYQEGAREDRYFQLLEKGERVIAWMPLHVYKGGE